VSRQTQEIGIRMALGAERGDVLKMTLRTGLQLVTIGVVIGVSVSLAATRALASQLWNVSPSDPLTLVLVVVIVTVAGLAASYFPALRATRVDPMVVLRSE
jgi:putative ABC transport system permease protein